MGDKATSIGLRILLFAFGLVVLVLGLILLMPHPPAGAPAGLYVTCSLITLYALFFGPLLVGDSIEELSGGRTVSLGIYYLFLGVYALLTVVLVYYAVTGVGPTLSAIVVIQLAGLFGVAIGAYMAVSSGQRIADVKQREIGKRSSVERLRATSQRLSAQTSRLDTQDQIQGEIVRTTKSIAEELRYLSPLHTPEAFALEEQIASYLDTLLASDFNSDMSSVAAQEALGYAQSALQLIEQRKAMRN